MLKGLVSKVFGTRHEREAKKMLPLVMEINATAEQLQPLSDDGLKAQTEKFRAILIQRTADLEEQLAELRQTKRQTEEAAERQSLTQQIQSTEDELKELIQDTLEELLPEVFATVKEACRRLVGTPITVTGQSMTWDMVPYDVQLIGGIALQRGSIAEMATGEGKTLVATLPLYLNGLAQTGAHLITVNDYLAKRDAQWMSAVYSSLGLTVGILQHDTAFMYDQTANRDDLGMRHLRPVTRREAYGADITYGTNNEYGFDYLRDNMVTDLTRAVQRADTPHAFAIVDEVDSILIDEARTPLIISGPAEETEEVYRTFARIVPRMQPELDFVIDLKHRSVTLTDAGVDKVEAGLGIKNLYDPQNFRLTRFMDAALKANFIYHKDQQYVVKDGEIVIVDEFTGRLMHGRRWSDGLHQAVEAKENVKIQRESVTYATITLQNYFRLYKKLSGMTGTAWTEREELHQIYGLDVIMVPTHREMIRIDMGDIIYRTAEGKWRAVVDEIEDAHADGRPILVGTVAIETSEMLADLMKRTATCRLEDCGRFHKICPLKDATVLNAKQHEREGQIVALAGVLGAVTIATNMAGRGTDIILGGNPDRMADELARKRGIDLITAPEPEAAPIREEARGLWQADHERVVEVGGLHIVGTERHESRRIDNQLRGRAGRQGDPGSSRFFVSFGDDLMKRFSPEWVPNLLARMGMDEDTPLESGMVSKSIEQAQSKVEGHNFDIRKHVVQYDDVMNRHRDVIYKQRRRILGDEDLRADIIGDDDTKGMIVEQLESAFDTFAASNDPEDWDAEALHAEIKAVLPLPASFTPKHLQELGADAAYEEVIDLAHKLYEEKEKELTPERMRTLERLVLLRVIDRLWVYHLTALEELRQGIGLVGYGQKDPLVEFKREAFDMFDQLNQHIRQNMARQIYHVTLTAQVQRPEPPKNVQESGPAEAAGSPVAASTATAAPRGKTKAAAAGTATAATAAPGNGASVSGKTGRNDPCPCGSGKKYKKCHGAGGVAGVS